MFADIYAEIERIRTEDEQNAFWEVCNYFPAIPWIRRTGFYFHTFTRADGSYFREAFLTVKLLRTIIWRCRMLQFRNSVRRYLGI